MLKAQLEERVKELESNNYSLSRSLSDLKEVRKELEEVRIHYRINEQKWIVERTILRQTVRDLKIRNDVLTMTPEQIKNLIEVKKRSLDILNGREQSLSMEEE